jgi:hypothetical protein
MTKMKRKNTNRRLMDKNGSWIKMVRGWSIDAVLSNMHNLNRN